MSLMPYKGKLYAGTSCWMETNATQLACQLLVLGSSGGTWKQLYKFAATNLRLTSLRTVTFTTDSASNPVAPVTMLLAATDKTIAGTVQAFSLDDNTGSMVAMPLGSTTNSQQTRAIGFHRDPVTGVDTVFAGNDDLGIIPGGYNPSATGRIQWNTNGSELAVPVGEHVMSFTEADGVFYCATSKHIYQRTDGVAPTWTSIYYEPNQTEATGIRGLTAVPNAAGTGQILLFLSLNVMRHLDPAAGNHETLEQDFDPLLSRSWGHKVTCVLGAYNDFLPCTNAATGELVYLFGFEAALPAADLANNPQLRIFTTPGSGALAVAIAVAVGLAVGLAVGFREPADLLDRGVHAFLQLPIQSGGLALHLGEVTDLGLEGEAELVR